MSITQLITYQTRRESHKKIILTADNDYKRIYNTLRLFGKMTAREVAARTGLELVTVRARLTEMSTCDNPVIEAVEKKKERNRNVAVYQIKEATK